MGAAIGLGSLTIAWYVVIGRDAPHRDPADEAYFGLSPTRTGDGKLIPTAALGNSDYCGHCHTQIFHEWNASMHHFSSFNNPFYRKVALETAQRRGEESLKFCAGCHDPIPLLGGEMPQRNLSSWAANAGITCLVCHRITQLTGHGNGGYVVSPPTLHPFSLSDTPLLKDVHGFLVQKLPWLHRAVLSKPFYSSSEYCRACHTLVSPAALNGVDDLVLQDEYAHWSKSRFAAKGHSVGVDRGKTCADCHMPLQPSTDPAAKQGLARSHRFVGGNNVVSAINRDDDQQTAVEQFLRGGAVALDFARLRRNGLETTFDRLAAEPGDTLDIGLQLTNRGVGHDFPGGTADSNEAWIELKATAADGRSVFHSGGVSAEGQIDRTATFLEAPFLDREGRRTDRRNATTEATERGRSRTIAASASLGVDFRVRLPRDVHFPIRIVARLNWRKFSPDFVQWVFAPRKVEDASIVVMSEQALTIQRAATHQGSLAHTSIVQGSVDSGIQQSCVNRTTAGSACGGHHTETLQ